MKMFFIFLLVAIFAITFLSCEERRIRRQIWPTPNNPNYFWAENGPRDDRDFLDYGDFWVGPQRFDQSQKNQNNLGENFNSKRDRNDMNQNRRTTTESLGPITSTPVTIHYAPKGCKCPMTQEFNPVCGTDGNTYKNKGLLNCYQRCGTSVFQRRLGRC